MRARCTSRHNLGLLLRWTAALAEMRAYRLIPRAVQREIIATFGASVRRGLAQVPAVTLEITPPVDTSPLPGDAEPQETLATVLSFSLRESGGSYLGVDELKRMARRLGAQGIHLGQPVRLGRAGAPVVLRVAIGAPLVRAVAVEPSLGSQLADRLRWLDAQSDALSAKLNALLAEQQAGE
jgi:hypothetical protein